MRRLASALVGLALVVAFAALGASSAEAVRYKGAPKYVGVVSYVPGTIKVSGKSVKQYHTRLKVPTSTLTIRAKKRWKIAALGSTAYTACQPANKTVRIGVTKGNSGRAKQFIVKPC